MARVAFASIVPIQALARRPDEPKVGLDPDRFDKRNFERQLRINGMANLEVGFTEDPHEVDQLAEFKSGRKLLRPLVGVGRTAGALMQQHAQIGDQLAIELPCILARFDRLIHHAKRGAGFFSAIASTIDSIRSLRLTPSSASTAGRSIRAGSDSVASMKTES